MKKAVKSRKYFAPQTDNTECGCDFPGCEKPGEYRAPKDRGLKEYYWFCLEHVQAYNARWNYYANEFAEDEENPKKKAKMHFRSKVDYQFGYRMQDDFEFFGSYGGNFSSRKEVYFNTKEKEFLEIMEMDGKDVSLATLKKQYKKLAKKHHPDMHRNDKKAEEKFKQLTAAYKALLAKFS